MIEVALLLLSIMSLLLYYFDIFSSDLALIRSVNLTAIVYLFFVCFEPFEAKDSQTTSVLPRIIAIGFSLSVLGALFKLMNYPGQVMMLQIGAVSMPIAALVGIFNSRGNWSNNFVALIVRLSLITTLSLVLWFL